MGMAMFDSGQFEQAARDSIIRAELEALTKRLEEYKKYRDYYNGDQTIVYSTVLFRDLFGDAFEGFRDNWMRPIVEPVLDKMQLTGIQVNKVNKDNPDPSTADAVWDVFRMNEIDEEQFNLHEGMSVESHAYMIVWPDEEKGATLDWQPAGLVRIRYDSDNRRKALWAVKRWQTEDGAVYVTIYTDKFAYKFVQLDPVEAQRRESTSQALDEIPDIGPMTGLKERRVANEPWPLRHPFGEVPVVEFGNPGWRSDLADAIPQQDALNKTLLDMLVAAEFNASPQRVVETIAQMPAGGWKTGPAEVWHVPVGFDPDGKAIRGQYHEFQAGDPSNFIKMIEMWRQHMALTSRTPLRYFVSVDRGGRGDAPSGDSLLVDDQPHNNKIARKQMVAGNRHMQVARLIAKALEKNPKDLLLGEMIWRDPRFEFRTAILEEAKLMVEVGLPFKWVIQKLGLRPEEVAEIERLKQEEIEEQQKRQEEAAAAAEQNADEGSSSQENEDD